jgi:hypothetical protein
MRKNAPVACATDRSSNDLLKAAKAQAYFLMPSALISPS